MPRTLKAFLPNTIPTITHYDRGIHRLERGESLATRRARLTVPMV